VASYTRDAMGRITALSVTPPGGSALPVVSGVSYQPFGPVSALTYGNGITDARTFDLDYRPTAITYRATTLSWNLGYSYDLDNNVTGIADNVFGNQSFGYDQLNRLVQASGWYGSGHASYDPVGNVSFLAGDSMSYAAGTNRLASVSIGSTTVRSLGYTASGNIASDQRSNQTLTLGYNQANRLASVTVQPTGGQQTSYSYLYDAAGQRLAKLVNGSGGTLTVYQYDRAGHLLEEASLTSSTLTPQVDYLYLDGRPVATLSPNGTLIYLHTDQLGTPQAATTTSQQVVRADAYNPLGGTKPLVNLVPQNLRFPGQYADAESGFYHNGFRDYDPRLGRYLESDPIGVKGGLNTYLYALANPESFTDPLGLKCRCETKCPCENSARTEPLISFRDHPPVPQSEVKQPIDVKLTSGRGFIRLTQFLTTFDFEFNELLVSHFAKDPILDKLYELQEEPDCPPDWLPRNFPNPRATPGMPGYIPVEATNSVKSW
jgi:RHS repeat-associated protein